MSPRSDAAMTGGPRRLTLEREQEIRRNHGSHVTRQDELLDEIVALRAELQAEQDGTAHYMRCGCGHWIDEHADRDACSRPGCKCSGFIPTQFTVITVDGLRALRAELQRAREAMADKATYFLSRDQSTHWYVVPMVKEAEWNEWCNLPEDDERAWRAPEFAVPVGGSPSQILFVHWGRR